MKKGRVPASIPAEPHLRKQLRDPEFAAAYLSYTAESDDPSDFMFALREVTEAHGGIGKIAKRAKLNRQQLYKTLSRGGQSGIAYALGDARRRRIHVGSDANGKEQGKKIPSSGRAKSEGKRSVRRQASGSPAAFAGTRGCASQV